MMRGLTLVLVVLVSRSLWAGPPTIRELRPWGAQRGQAVTLTVLGDQLAPGAETFSAIPGKLTEQPGANAGQLIYQLQIAPDAVVGVYPVRLRTSGGLSNVLLFSVGDLPEVSEVEPNDLLPGAVGGTERTAAPGMTASIPPPVTINGTATGQDFDTFQIAGKKGQRLVIEIEAQRIGSLLDATLHLFSAAGRELAVVDDTPGLGSDCRLDVTTPEDGDYLVVVHDSKYAGASPGQYRLKLGSFAYAAAVFPLGWQRGQEFEATLLGGTFAEPVRTKIRAQAPTGWNWAFVTPPNSPSHPLLPFRLALGDEPEQLEPASSAIDDRWFKSAVMNGRLAAPGEVDRYKLAVSAGQSWGFEIEAANLGSPLDALLSVLGPQGNVLATADDGNGLDPRLQFTVPAGIDHVLLSVEDLHRRGGPLFAYRLKARPAKMDFSLQIVPPGQPAPGSIGPLAVNIPRGGVTVVQVNTLRSGYNGPIQLSIPENLSYITAEDGLIPAGASTGTLVLMAAADAPLQALDLEIRGSAGPATQPMWRTAESAGRGSSSMAESLVARVPAALCEPPPAKFTPAESAIRILHGHSRQLKIAVQRGPQATEAITLNPVGTPPPSIGGLNGTIPKEASELTLSLSQNPEIPVLGTFSLQLAASTPVAGRAETVQVPPVKVEIVRPFSIELLNQVVTVMPGSKTRIAVVVRREAPFDGVVKIAAAGSLPQHITLAPLNVATGESLAVLELSADTAAAPAEFDLPIRASSEMEGRKRDKDYVIPDSTVKVKIAPPMK